MLVSKELEARVKLLCENNDTKSEMFDKKVEDHLRDIRCGDTNVQPSFQRNYVWRQDTASRLIESILLRYIIPPIHLSEALVGDSKTVAIVIDGQQRLTTLLNFVDNIIPMGVPGWVKSGDFKLVGLEILSDLNGLSFKDLPASMKQTILSYKLRAIIGSGSNKDAVAELFIRLNQNTWKMNAAEIRNALYHSEFITFLSKLANNQLFVRLTRKKDNNRFGGSDIVARFMAFYRQGYTNYSGKIEGFIQSEMSYWRAHHDSQVLAHYESRLLLALQTSEAVFGPNVFHREGRSHGKISNVMFELIASSFASRSFESVLAKKDELVAACARVRENPEFIASITKSTNERSRVQTRFRLWNEALDAVLGVTKQEPTFKTILTIPEVKPSLEDVWLAGEETKEDLEARTVSYVRDTIRGSGNQPTNWFCDVCNGSILTEQADSVDVFGLVQNADKTWECEIKHNPADCVQVLAEVA